MKAATTLSVYSRCWWKISIHAAREGGDYAGLESTIAGWISIHAAREGGDTELGYIKANTDISIHAAREGGDKIFIRITPANAGFQSTPPVKAATETDEIYTPNTGISIHAAREGGDIVVPGADALVPNFNPRRP